MNYYDDENFIIESFRNVDDKSVFFPNLTDEAEEAYISIHDEQEWKYWTYSAGKNDPPPDFFNTQKRFMMDVMIVEDNSFIGKKRNPVNPTKAQEGVMKKELEKSGILESFPDLQNVTLIGHTGLPTREDHNYDYYRENFKRVIQNHISKITKYNENHPGYKNIFFIMDESTAYFQAEDANCNVEEGEKTKGKLHFHFFDKVFFDVFTGSEIDYLIWYTPYKHIWADSGKIDLPEAVIYDVKNMDVETIVYDSSCMLSCEV